MILRLVVDKLLVRCVICTRLRLLIRLLVRVTALVRVWGNLCSWLIGNFAEQVNMRFELVNINFIPIEI